jgi:N-acetylglucosamine-6-phosphate deacetylase
VKFGNLSDLRWSCALSIVLFGARKLDAEGEVDDFWMLVRGDTIVASGTGSPPSSDSTVDIEGCWLTPGFIDLHSHGGGGASFDDGAESIAAGHALHRAHGMTRSVISLLTNPVTELEESLRTVAQLAAIDPLVRGSISKVRFCRRSAAALTTRGLTMGSFSGGG